MFAEFRAAAGAWPFPYFRRAMRSIHEFHIAAAGLPSILPATCCQSTVFSSRSAAGILERTRSDKWWSMGHNMRKEKQAVEEWYFFGMYGMVLSDERLALADNLADDVALLSRVHLGTLRINREFGDGYIAKTIAQHKEVKDCETFLGIRVKGYRPCESNEESDDEVNKPDQSYSKAYYRARLVSALLTFCDILKGRSPCALAEDRIQQVRTVFALSDGDWSTRSGLRGMAMSWGRQRCPISLATLRAELGVAPISLLREMILSRKSNGLHLSLRKAIENAALALYAAMHVCLEDLQVIGSMKTLELLLRKTQRETYQTIRNRVTALIGAKVAAHYKADDLFSSRHDFAHHNVEARGLRNTDGAPAMRMALHCLVRYIEAAEKSHSRDNLIAYLDFVHRADELNAMQPVEKQLDIKAFLRNARCPLKLGLVF